MDRKRVVTAFMLVTCLGAILSMVGSFVASGIDQGGSLYNILSTTSVGLSILCIVASTLHPDFSKAKQDQSQAEQDSSLV
jgi:hypothetical protein